MNSEMVQYRDNRKKELVKPLMESIFIAIALLAISFGSFSPRTRREIMKRDRYTCINCGKRCDLEAAHFNHNKKRPDYDSASNGRALCIDCHLLDHVQNEDRNGLTRHQNRWAINRIKERIAKKHTTKSTQL